MRTGYVLLVAAYIYTAAALGVADDSEFYSDEGLQFDDRPQRRDTEHPDWFKLSFLDLSEDLDEVLALSDRVAVMFEGSIVGTVDPATTSREQIGLMMAGVVDEA